MGEYFPEQKSLAGRVNVELDLSNYARKTDLKIATGLYTSKFAEYVDLPHLKSNADKFDTEKRSN